ncbi:MAG: hypothetical protein PHO53_02435 [Actinomycetota bacterium]|nr:hypothetical protein [Actinomycetota bacterium]
MPKTVLVGSSSKKAGKTSFSCFLVKALGADLAMKVSTNSEHREDYGIISDPAKTQKPGTDTGRLWGAGARNVVWVNTSGEPKKTRRLIEDSIEKTGSKGLLIIEGNSSFGCVPEATSVFLMDVPIEEFKPSATSAIRHANLILVDTSKKLKEIRREKLAKDLRERAPGARVIFYSEKEKAKIWEEATKLVKEMLPGEKRQPPLTGSKKA